MSIQQQLTDAMKQAMRDKDSLRLNAIRMARTAIKNAEIEARADLDDAGILKVLATLVKQRREAADAYRATRPELAEKEEAELAVLQEFMPVPLSAAELEQMVAAAIEAAGATTMRDMGAVMKLLAPQTTGRADGKQVSDLVRQKLGSA